MHVTPLVYTIIIKIILIFIFNIHIYKYILYQVYMVRSPHIERDGCSLALDQAAATTSVLELSQGALAAAYKSDS